LCVGVKPIGGSSAKVADFFAIAIDRVFRSLVEANLGTHALRCFCASGLQGMAQSRT
jgi:hypothetical protein